jgi:hypothetical protein
MDEWTCQEVKTFLIRKGFSEDLANDLEAKEVDGQVLSLVGSSHKI